MISPVVGAGIVGLAHALAAVKRGKRVVVIERDARAVGASIRNFGFVTVTGQQTGDCWRRARRSRDIWAEIAPEAGIEVVHHGLTVVAQRKEAMTVLEAFANTEMGELCTLLSAEQAAERISQLNQASVIGGLYSPHELRVESRDAIPRLERWLGESKGFTFLWCTAVHDISLPEIHTSNGTLRAERGILCAGDDFRTLFPERFTAYETQICKLQMMRVIPSDGFGRLESAVMSDLSLVRYLGYSELPEARPLLERLLTEQGQALHYGIHLIVVQSRDGSLVVGDSHQIEHTPDCFVDSVVEAVILEELTKIMRVPDYRVSERWVGTYGMSNAGLVLIDRPSRGLRLVSVTSGTGASTAFGIAEKAISELL